ncbi:hypothetical protein K435DRAFT_193570 [Dendrothele bispora CBS 962.96]|uniref:Uncharacterized protein n=1 Tax=Dendrothele bispora (strain CBS 962.96) TaxID=1314807 RepID=A0A4S8LV83_DENBC|nr:hypothetical protein K435DRAFT_193570 [Dendrothele bispora CBS 962.96]
MTTTFASLTDGVPILGASAIASYLSFFALVWWIWASQVAYNVRFRQGDWLHRLFIFLQVFVFSALAAFTKSFSVTNGIEDDTRANQQIANLQEAAFGQSQQPWINVQEFRESRIPTLNVRGISMTMGFSRLLLLAQYGIAFFHAWRLDRQMLPFSRHAAFLVHITALVLSSLCYFIAFIIIGKDPDETDEIVKFILWYIPLFLEITAHFLALSSFCQDRVPYKAEAITARSCTVFVIILGGGLDRITGAFQYGVGNFTFNWTSLGIIFCAVVIFLLLFSLYFGTSAAELEKMGSKRVISGFFFQFFYLSAIIVTLQGIAALLRAGYLGSALETPLQFLRQSQSILESKGFPVPLNVSDYADTDIQSQLTRQGVALNGMLPFINSAIQTASQAQPVDYNLTFNALLQMDVLVIEIVLDNLDMLPDSGVLLARLEAFYYSDPQNYSAVNNETFNSVFQRVIVSNASPALWFYAAGGAVLVTLGLLGLIRQWPRDKYEWGQIISRLVMGSATIAATGIDANANANVLGEDFRYHSSGIWWLVTEEWVLAPYAFALLIEQVIELVLLHLAGRGLVNFRSQTSKLEGNRQSSRIVYSRTGTLDNAEAGFGREKKGSREKRRDQYWNSSEEYVDPHAQEESRDEEGLPPATESPSGIPRAVSSQRRPTNTLSGLSYHKRQNTETTDNV